MNFGQDANTSNGSDLVSLEKGAIVYVIKLLNQLLSTRIRPPLSRMASLKTETLVSDLQRVDDLLRTCNHGLKRNTEGISSAMRQGLYSWVSGVTDGLPIDAMRLLWQNEISKRVSTDTEMPNSE